MTQGPTNSYDRGYRTEIASGYAGTPVARQQGPLGALQEAFGNVRNYFSRGYESGLGNIDIGSGIDNILATDPIAGIGNIGRAIQGVDTGALSQAAVGIFSPALALYLANQDKNVFSFSTPDIFGGSVPRGDEGSGSRGRVAKRDTSGSLSLQTAISRLQEERDRTTFDRGILQTAYDRQAQAYYAERDKQVADLKAAHMDRLGELQDELSGYKGGLGEVNAAYASYADDANVLLEAAASVEAEELGESSVADVVAASFDEFEGAMMETLKKIDSTGNTALAEAMGKEVRYMEGVMIDGLRSGLMSQTEMHALASAEAQALSHMAWKDDAYQAERNRYVLEAQINKTISDKQEQLVKARDDMNKAIKDAQEQFGEFSMSPDDLWTAAMDDYFTSKEFDPLTQQNMIALFNSIKENNPAAMLNYEEFKGEVARAINQKNLATVGVLDTFMNILGQLESNGSPAYATMYTALHSTMSKEELSAILNTPLMKPLFAQYGLDVDTIQWDRIDDSGDRDFEALLDLWGHHDDFQNNYLDYVTSQAVTSNQTINNSGSLGQAPSNQANRNQPLYVYRRETTMPYMADKISSLFPQYGVTFGGFNGTSGIIRTDDRGAANSDHRSGGALDVYANSEEGRLAIANWARSMYGSGISVVVYEGDSDHEGHHVHISTQIGYQVPGTSLPGGSYTNVSAPATATASTRLPQQGQGGPI